MHKTWIDKRGYLYIDGVKVARWVPERQVLEFIDRDRRRAAERGTRVVTISIEALAMLTKEGD